jgi:hypothetical protein
MRLDRSAEGAVAPVSLPVQPGVTWRAWRALGADRRLRTRSALSARAASALGRLTTAIMAVAAFALFATRSVPWKLLTADTWRPQSRPNRIHRDLGVDAMDSPPEDFSY